MLPLPLSHAAPHPRIPYFKWEEKVVEGRYKSIDLSIACYQHCHGHCDFQAVRGKPHDQDILELNPGTTNYFFHENF